jgi:hypothetical protein
MRAHGNRLLHGADVVLPRITWVRFFVWLLIGLSFYLSMVVWHDHLQRRGVSKSSARLWTSAAGLRRGARDHTRQHPARPVEMKVR